MENLEKPGSLLTEDEAAQVLKVSPRTLQAWRAQGLGPPYVQLSSRLIRYRASDLNDLVEVGLHGGSDDKSPSKAPLK